jgi:hypothetical protein
MTYAEGFINQQVSNDINQSNTKVQTNTTLQKLNQTLQTNAITSIASMNAAVPLGGIISDAMLSPETTKEFWNALSEGIKDLMALQKICTEFPDPSPQEYCVVVKNTDLSTSCQVILSAYNQACKVVTP